MLNECDKWPKQRMGADEDILYGRGLVEAMRPFISALLKEKITDRTAQNI
jgi:hypothetical protein